MVAVGAFNQVQQALRWFVDNSGIIADWRATLLRVSSFRQALVEMDKFGGRSSRISLVETKEDKLTFDNLGIASPSGCTVLSEPHLEVNAGEHVLIIGEIGTGKTILFRAVAGLWPWGSGRIGMPARETVMFMPRRPYIPPGLLRDALAYPLPADQFETEDFVAVLDRLGLTYLNPSLDRAARWDRELSDDEQQTLAFARMLLQKPRWVFTDEALDSLEDETREIVLDIFKHEMVETALISMGRSDRRNGFFTRAFFLIKDPQGQRLAPACEPSALPVKKVATVRVAAE
jgi:putative ATP-binding cassette transporter